MVHIDLFVDHESNIQVSKTGLGGYGFGYWYQMNDRQILYDGSGLTTDQRNISNLTRNY